MGAEFDLITRFFAGATPARSDVAAGIGDDAALVMPPAGGEIVTVCTALHEGTDFPPGTPARPLGARAIEDGLRALRGAAAGIGGAPPRPAWAVLGLTLPAPDPEWTGEFAAGLAAACRAADVQLIGGDTTRGPRTVVCMLHGLHPGRAGDPGRADETSRGGETGRADETGRGGETDRGSKADGGSETNRGGEAHRVGQSGRSVRIGGADEATRTDRTGRARK